MSPEFIHSLWTVLLFLVFLGIVAWAWSRRRREAFEAAARLPLEDDHDTGERTHG